MDRYEALREQVLPVLLPYGVEEIALFGSVARGEETAAKRSRPPRAFRRTAAAAAEPDHMGAIGA